MIGPSGFYSFMRLGPTPRKGRPPDRFAETAFEELEFP
jgi:uncharacterized protein YozE (UPF0346 family)